MRPSIRSISTIDGQDPANFRPSDTGSFSVTFRMLIGPADSPGEESFDVTVCSPTWLESECERDQFVVGRHHLIVAYYDFTNVQNLLYKLVDRCRGDSWHEIAEKLSRLAFWEFEDYRP